ncbi:MAG: hypothetical protein KM296_00365 [Brockia lithotrophica]|nr:hypothetical protein [Brockia lithotrophica]
MKFYKKISEWYKLDFVKNYNLTPVIYIDLRDNTITNTFTYSSSMRTVPMDVYYGLIREIFISKDGDPTHVVELLKSDELDHLFFRVFNGSEVKWDGQNLVGYLDDDAVEALEDLQHIFEHGIRKSNYVYIHPADWFDRGYICDLVKAESTDEELKSIAEELTGIAFSEGVYFEKEEAYELLKDVRHKKQEEYFDESLEHGV